MKNLIFNFGIAFLFILSACEESDNTKPDIIKFEQINKTIIASQPDSMSGACQHIVFNITGNETESFQAFIYSSPTLMLCDGGNEFLVDEKTNQIISLAENTEITENGTWKGCSNKLYLEQFSGKGGNYIGYRELAYPSGIPIYYYGWIKIDLSSDNRTLKIISRANNQTEYNIITTGKTK